MKNIIIKFLAVFFLLVLINEAHSQDYIFVKHDASGMNNGTSWVDAYTSLESALNSATADDTIWVAAGTYNPENEVGGTGARFRSFQLINEVGVYGGFAGNEDPATFDLDDRDFEANETILSGDLGSENVYHVFRHVDIGLNSTAILDGFTISGGVANGSNPENKGGGMLNSASLEANGSSPTIRNCVFKDNEAEEGGAMHNTRYCSPEIINTLFENNTATSIGGAVYLVRNTTTFDNCTFHNNTSLATGSNVGGGAVFITTSDAAEGTVFTNCTFTENTVNSSSSGARGGAIHGSINPGFLTIEGSVFEDNEAQYGGAIYHTGSDANRNNSEISISRSSFELNAAEFGGAIFSERHNTILTSCIIRGNEATEQSGGFYERFGASQIINSLLSGNKSAKHGGAVYLNTETAEIINTTIAGNYSDERGGGISIIGETTVEIKNTIVWGNASPEGNELWLCNDCTANIDYCLYGDGTGDVFITSGGTLNATNSLNSDPDFLSPEAPTSGNTPNLLGNYELQSASPAIDAGFNDHLPAGITTDLLGNDRIVDGNSGGSAIIDLGAYEKEVCEILSIAPTSGDGLSAGTAYEIATFENLLWITEDSDRWDKFYIQTADIDAAVTQTSEMCFGAEGWSPIGNSTTAFSGSYDGDGHTISNLFIVRSGTNSLGLFGVVNSANIDNLGMVDVNISGANEVGGLAGFVDNSTIENSYSTGLVNGNQRVGGLVGSVENTTIENSYSMGSVEGSNTVGGLTGFVTNSSSIENSFSSAQVNGQDVVGGFAGFLIAESSIGNSYSTGQVGGNDRVGGFVGSTGPSAIATINNSYSSGNVNGGFISTGGFIGLASTNLTTTSSYWDVETSGIGNSGDNNGGAIGKTTADMVIISTFSGWDFDDIWTSRSIPLDDSVSYPYLQGLVPDTLPGLAEGTVANQNKEHNYITIQSAVDDAEDGDLITLGGGNLYVEMVNTNTGPAGGIALSSGNTPGCDTIIGTLALTAVDSFVVDIEGTTPCTEYDRLTVTGSVALNDADLVLNLDYLPQDNDMFIVLEYGGALAGEFTQGNTVTAEFNGMFYDFDIDYGTGAGSEITLTFDCANISAAAVAPDLISDVYQIDSFPNLLWISENSSSWDADFIQTSDIDAEVTQNESCFGADGWSPIGNSTTAFSGSYDGDGHTISNLFIVRSGTNSLGLFGVVNSANIDNLGMVDVNISGAFSNEVGGLVGFVDNSTCFSPLEIKTRLRKNFCNYV